MLHDDVVVLALRRAPELELRDEPAGSPAARALFARVPWRSCASGSGPEFEPTEEIFATERAFEEERAGFVVLYARGRPVGAAACRSLGPEVAEIKRMFVTAGARPRATAALLAELERRCSGSTGRAASACSPPRCWPRRARSTRRRATTEAEVACTSAGRRDVWLEQHAWACRPPAGSAVTTPRGLLAPVGGRPRRWDSCRA